MDSPVYNIFDQLNERLFGETTSPVSKSTVNGTTDPGYDSDDPDAESGGDGKGDDKIKQGHDGTPSGNNKGTLAQDPRRVNLPSAAEARQRVDDLTAELTEARGDGFAKKAGQNKMVAFIDEQMRDVKEGSVEANRLTQLRMNAESGGFVGAKDLKNAGVDIGKLTEIALICLT